MLAPGATSRRSEFASNDGLHATWTDPLTGAKILAVAGEDPDTMSIAVAPKRLGWWFATDADRSAWPLAIYILTAGFLGMLWNIVLFVIPFTSRPFTAGSPSGDQFLTTSALAVASCMISTLFRRPILRAKPLLLPVLATGLMFLAAGLFTIMWFALEAFAGEIPWEWSRASLALVLMVPVLGMLGALYGCWVTVPVATLHLIALRAVARASQTPASTASSSPNEREPLYAPGVVPFRRVK